MAEGLSRAGLTSGKSRRITSVFLALSCFLILVCLLKGNMQIGALPCALWVALTTWPIDAKRQGSNKATKKKSVARSRGWVPLVLSMVLLICAVGLAVSRVSDDLSSRGKAVETRMSEGEQLAQSGKFGEALAVFESIDIPDDLPLQKARKHHNCGVLLLQLKRPDEAVTHLLRSLRYDPGNAQAAFLVGKVLADRGSREEARRMLEMSLRIDPSFEQSRRLSTQLSEHAEALREGHGR